MDKAKFPIGQALQKPSLCVLTPLLLAAVLFAEFVSWLPPHAQLVQAYPYNATHLTAAFPNGVVFIVQEGLSFNGTEAESQVAVQYLYTMCRYTAVDVHNATSIEQTVLWVGDVYCTQDGRSWLWLKWLPLRFTAYRGDVNFTYVNLTVKTPAGDFAGAVPEGWYLDTATKAVFRLPGENLTWAMRYREMEAAIERLREELQKAVATGANASALVQRLRSQVEELQRQKVSLEQALRQRESQLAALQASLRSAVAEAEALRRQVEQLKAEKEALQRRVAELNDTYVSQINNLQAQLATMSVKLSAHNEEGMPAYVIAGVATAAALAVAALVVKRRREE
ncbi:MAG: hypothetical protein QXP31_03325 [Pyrobaculum sp.]